jgi:2-polyprenyl-3-methyl-5-hydroxy-6-metoxy-1,4-benzoquinol methylase
MNLSGDYLEAKSVDFSNKLNSIKSKHQIQWYPYGILHNFHNLKSIFNEYPLDTLTVGKILDCGAADGDLGFILESLGYSVECIENRSTNFNRGVGLETLRHELNSNLEINFIDLNSKGFEIFDNKSEFSLTFFLGIFYHLPNPLLALDQLSDISRYLVFSTRIAKFVNGIDISREKLAYLVSPNELNNDDTNWWIYSRAGLYEALNRTNWEVISENLVGDLTHSNPTDFEHDERIYLLLKSKKFS